MIVTATPALSAAAPPPRSRWQRNAAELLQMPRDLRLLLLVEALGALGGRLGEAGRYQLMLNEYAMEETEASALLGAATAIALLAGFASAPLVDLLGIRRVAMLSLAFTCVKLSLLLLTRARWVLTLVTLTPDVFPYGLAVYAIGLKNLTTPLARPTAFALSTVLINLGMFCGLALVDQTRHLHAVLGGLAFSGLRINLFFEIVLALLALLLVAAFLRDVKVVPHEAPLHAAPPADCGEVIGGGQGYSLVRLRYPGLRRCFGGGEAKGGAPQRAARPWLALLRSRPLWRVAVYNLAMGPARNQWAQMSTIMITFLTRYYGEAAPAYSIRSINPMLNSFAPALLAPFFSHLDFFTATLPALFLFGFSSLPLALHPSIGAAAAWVIISGLAEAVWSPRSRAWEVSMADDRQEAVFLTIAFLPGRLLIPFFGVLNGYLNQEFVPNCRFCRDAAGHFCSQAMAEPSGGCISSTHEQCHGLFLNQTGGSAAACPATCLECPGYVGHALPMFQLILAVALTSPLLLLLLLPFLRGDAAAESSESGEMEPKLAAQPCAVSRGRSAVANHLLSVGTAAPEYESTAGAQLLARQPSQAYSCEKNAAGGSHCVDSRGRGLSFRQQARQSVLQPCLHWLL
ncbi:hypothetical protein AB1Y20_010914 [Prymnesium parvum]|uniref:Solute carrier family 40 protein n=1 Tax=Prymnesium parvum TaxID=97485 RepID=A0AB34ISN3_PRYPA